MDKFDDITIHNKADVWVVSAFDAQKEELVELKVNFWDLVGFAAEYYQMDQKQAINHIGVCPEEEEDKLLKLFFVKQMS